MISHLNNFNLRTLVYNRCYFSAREGEGWRPNSFRKIGCSSRKTYVRVGVVHYFLTFMNTIFVSNEKDGASATIGDDKETL